MDDDEIEPPQVDDYTASGVPIIYVPRVRCPNCGGDDLKMRRSVNQGDGTRLQNTWCQTCKRKFFVVVE